MSELKVKEIACETAHEFVDYLRLSKPHWNATNSQWLFRGQNNNKWRLLPSLLREYEDNHWFESYKRQTIKNIKHQTFKLREWRDYNTVFSDHYANKYPKLYSSVGTCFSEANLLYEFVKNADKEGFDIPDIDLSILKNRLFVDYVSKILDRILPINWENANNELKRNYLARNSFEAKPYIALAQHHGIYTRLLDMTLNPMIAAYFAFNNLNPDDSLVHDDKIVVWAINSKIFQGYRHIAHDTDKILASYGYYIVSRAKNKYLQRQEGVFIYPIHPYQYYYNNEHYPSFEDYLAAFYGNNNLDNSVARKVTLPYSQIHELIYILDIEGYNKVKMMPTLDNLVESLKTRWQWETKATKNTL